MSSLYLQRLYTGNALVILEGLEVIESCGRRVDDDAGSPDLVGRRTVEVNVRLATAVGQDLRAATRDDAASVRNEEEANDMVVESKGGWSRIQICK